MNSSKEDLLELVELSPPCREKPSKNNVDASSPLNTATYSLHSAQKDAEIRSIFSVSNRSSDKHKNDEAILSEDRTISEISDNIFLVNPETSRSRNDNQKTYKQKIAEHLKKIKQKASIPQSELHSKSNKLKIPVERIRRESENVNAEIEMVRNKFRSKSKDEMKKDREKFFNFSSDQNDKVEENTSEERTGHYVRYKLPENMNFSLTISKKECTVYHPFKMFGKKFYSSKISRNDGPKLSNWEYNLLHKRLSNDDRWFGEDGQVKFTSNPIRNEIFRPKMKKIEPSINVFSPPSLGEDCTEVVVNNILDVHLYHLKYFYHPLFSIEHVFAERLKSFYEEYLSYQTDNKLEKLRNRLVTLRSERKERQSSETITDKVKSAREIYFEEACSYRELITKILNTWKRLKKIRETQSFFNTSVRLKIKREPVDIDKDKEVYDQFFNETLDEIINEQKSNLKTTEISNETKHDAVNDSSLTENGTVSMASQDVGIKREKLEQELLKTFKKNFGSPGEPLVHFSLVDDFEATKQISDREEIQRRNAVDSLRIFLKILCNGIEVCKSKNYSLDHSFNLEINERISIQLTDVPKFLTVEIFEVSKMKQKKKSCVMNLPIPKENSNKRVLVHKFERKEIMRFKRKGLGKGSDLRSASDRFGIKISNKENFDLKVKGFLRYAMEWDRKQNRCSRKESLYDQRNILNEIVNRDGSVDHEKLKSVLENNEELFGDNVGVIKEILAEGNDSKYFRLGAEANLLRFCNITEIEQNIRLKILQLRNQNEIEFDGLPVPLRIKEIPFDVLADYKRRKALEERDYFEEEFDDDDIESQRNMGKKFLKQVYVKVFQKCKNIDCNLEYESVVDEGYLIHLSSLVKTLFENFLNWFRWQPQISKPLPIYTEKMSKQVKDAPIPTNNNVVIVVTIYNGKNIPNRTKHTFADDTSQDNQVQPFVRIDYKNGSARTDAASGSNPVWNQVLHITLDSIHTDYLNPNSLEGKLLINLFDESDIAVKKLNDKKCVNWLGSLDIPLSAFCCPNGMKGFFKINSPHVLMGYETEAEKYRTKSPKVSNIQSHQTYLEMEFNLHPNIPKLFPNMEKLHSADIPVIEDHIIKWSSSYQSMFPNRKFSAMAIDTNCRTVCVIRYLKPLEPPQLNLEEFDVTPEQCMRYVSLIPFTTTNHFYSNIWLTTDQLLQLMTGSVIDHAVALTCYLLAMKMDVWLILGYGIPQGYAAWVLSKEYTADNDAPVHYIYDVVRNEKYNVTDELCSLLKIYCVINNENLWANIQRTDKPNLMRYEFSRKSDWLPLFNNEVNAPINFMINKVRYKPRSSMEDLEIHLERQIKKQIAKLRQLDRTIWNPHLSSSFKNILRSFEMNCMYNKNHFETMTELNTVVSHYEVTGFAVNIPFINLSSIAKGIKNLGIHVTDDTKNEFVLSVYIHSYPSNVLSVWIMFASVKRKDESLVNLALSGL